jgi:hypothetical protein
MKLISQDQFKGIVITQFGSKNSKQYPILKTNGQTQVSTLNLEPEGIIGMHKAVTDQLFLIFKGNGWIRNETSERIDLKEGMGVLWEKGELHESGTDSGMLALVIEGENLIYLV